MSSDIRVLPHITSLMRHHCTNVSRKKSEIIYRVSMFFLRIWVLLDRKTVIYLIEY